MFQLLDKFLPPDDEEIYNFDLPPINISIGILSKVIEFCHHYQTIEVMNDIQRPLQSHRLERNVTQEWYYNFINTIEDQRSLFRLVNAANYLGVEPLLNLAVLALALRVQGKNEDEVKNILNIPGEIQVKQSKRKIFCDCYSVL